MKFSFLKYTVVCLLVVCGFASCDEVDNTWDPYQSWQSRNAQWFENVADTARAAIADAKAQYGDAWEEHCDWRMFKNLLKSQTSNSGKLADSICVKIVKRGSGETYPLYNDTVRVNFRAWLMETKYDDGNGGLRSESRVFAQTYYGEYNPQTAAPSLHAVNNSLIDGFSTALQNMVEGDDWFVYIPQELGYKGKTDNKVIPAYSTLLYRINMVAVYPAGTGVTNWK